MKKTSQQTQTRTQIPQRDQGRERSFEGLIKDLEAGVHYEDLISGLHIVGRERDSGGELDRNKFAALLKEKVQLGTILTQSRGFFVDCGVSFRLWKERPQFEGAVHPDASLNHNILLLGINTTIEQAYCLADLLERHYTPEKILHPDHMRPMTRVYYLR